MNERISKIAYEYLIKKNKIVIEETGLVLVPENQVKLIEMKNYQVANFISGLDKYKGRYDLTSENCSYCAMFFSDDCEGCPMSEADNCCIDGGSSYNDVEYHVSNMSDESQIKFKSRLLDLAKSTLTEMKTHE